MMKSFEFASQETQKEQSVESVSPDIPKAKGRCHLAVWKQVAVTLAIFTNFLGVGVSFGFTGIILPRITDPNSSDIYMNTEQASIYTSMLVVGCLVGSCVSAPLNIKLGQRVAILLITPVGVAGWLISYFAHSFWLYLLSRFMQGIYLAVLITCSPMYVTEVVHSSIRGRLMAIGDLIRQLGFLFVYVVGSTSLSWRIVGLVCGLTPLIIPCIVLLFLPDSPRWMAVVGKPEDQIKKSLQYFRGRKYEVQDELKDIQEDVANTKTSTIWDQVKFIKDKSFSKRFMLLAYLNFSVNFCGDLTILSYFVSIFQSAKTGISSYLSTIICGVLRVFGVGLYILIADRFGRRPNLMIFLTLSGFCTAILGVYFYLIHIDYDTSIIFWLPLASLILFTFCNCLYYPNFQLLRNELLPNRARSLGANILYFTLAVGMFIVMSTYPLMAKNIGEHWAFWLYSANSIMMVVVIYFFLPETKGKTLEEIAKLFQ